MDELLTVEQAAHELGMHPGAVRKAIGAKRLRARHFSPRVVLVSRAEVERYRAEGRRAGRPAGSRDKAPRKRARAPTDPSETRR